MLQPGSESKRPLRKRAEISSLWPPPIIAFMWTPCSSGRAGGNSAGGRKSEGGACSRRLCEIPVVAARRGADPAGGWHHLSRRDFLRGATTHAQHIGEAVSTALALIQIQHEVPVVHEVLLLENEQQARERCLDKNHNRGTEAAQTALAMAQVMSRLESWS